jgi:hypothetical protein
VAATISAYAEPAAGWSVSTATPTTASLTWSAGDVIVTLAGAEDATGGAPTVPTATGLTFTGIDVNANAAMADCRSAYAIAASGGSSTIASSLSKWLVSISNPVRSVMCRLPTRSPPDTATTAVGMWNSMQYTLIPRGRRGVARSTRRGRWTHHHRCHRGADDQPEHQHVERLGCNARRVDCADRSRVITVGSVAPGNEPLVTATGAPGGNNASMKGTGRFVSGGVAATANSGLT